MKLSANLDWAINREARLPEVSASLMKTENFLCAHFEVRETRSCFRAEVLKDGDPCYEDSCVEIFFAEKNGYRNFEFNSRGFCLSACGKNRFERKPLKKSEYEKIIRVPKVSFLEGEVFWTLDVKIPLDFCSENSPLRGNIYKCADKARTPHYLSLFKIESEKPDFHRPEFFGTLLP